MVTDSPKACTHIVTSRIARTIKFLSGISVCHYVVTPKWVEESRKAGIFRDEEQFALQDTSAEQLFGMELPTTLSRARQARLLEGIGIYATPGVQPPAAALGDIVSCAGGRLLDLTEAREALAAAAAAAAAAGRKEDGGERSCKVAPDGVIVLSTEDEVETDCCKEFLNNNISEWSLNQVSL